MKKTLKTLIVMLVSLNSCNEPETVVTDIVRADGSIERRIEMKGTNMKFNVSDVQVPYDSTWIIRDSLELTERGDTLRVRRAIKLFSSADELNNYYVSDSSLNKSAVRRVEFSKKFRWFSTHYKFCEIVEKRINHGYPVAYFLSDEERNWFYLPDGQKSILLTGPDSLKYKILDDSVNFHLENWMLRSLISEWINIFNEFTGGKGFPEDIRNKENILYDLVKNNENDFDSLWSQGVILEKLTGEKVAPEYRKEADSAMQVIEGLLAQKFSNYTVRIIMPGKELNTNGFRDSTDVPVWQVKSEFFMTEPYIMQAESKIINDWAWVITLTFFIFLAGAAFIKLKRYNSAA